MADNKSTQSGGVGLLGVLTLIFVTLKLIGVGTVATWSWWWVLSPTLIPLGIWAVCVLILVVMAAAVRK